MVGGGPQRSGRGGARKRLEIPFLRAAYRSGQFGRAVLAILTPLSEEERQAARATLPPAAWSLFEAMPRADQRHSLAVLRSVEGDWTRSQALAEAALLHDCAKGDGPFGLWQKVLAVLAGRFAGQWDQSAVEDEPRGHGWRRALWIYRNHPRRGAEAAEAAGCDPLTVRLILRHHEPPEVRVRETTEDRLLAELQRADELN